LGAAKVDQKALIIPTLILKDSDHVLPWVLSHERAALDARLNFDPNKKQWVLIPEQEGYRLTDDQENKLFDALKTLPLLEASQRKTFHLSLERVEPKVKAVDLSPMNDEIKALLVPTVKWTIDGKDTAFSLNDHQDMIQIDVDKKKISVDQDKIKGFVATIAATINQQAGSVQAHEPVLQDKGYLKAAYDGKFDWGRKLNQADMAQGILNALQSTAKETKLELKIDEIAPKLSMDGSGELSLLSQGISSFKLGNIPDRIFNVKFGLKKFDGVVIPPGQEFSFDQELGLVTYDAGWKPALAIMGGGAVQMQPGGGICQVSTTMYRAAILAGLPVTKSKPHSLDVSYYHQYGYGIDATVYPPAGLDLKFINDTPGPILIHTYTKDDQTNAFVELYGLSDGRKIDLTPNKNYKFAADDGRTGRYISWNWVVTKADGKVDDRKIETVYKGVH
jgi:vancomycin resistance protein YoaR